MGDIARARRGSKTGRRNAVILLIICITIALLRQLPSSYQNSLDSSTDVSPQVKINPSGGDSFPGSAFFLAESTLQPASGAAARNPKHILILEQGAAAPATLFRGLTPIDRYRAANCLAAAVYYEAGNEPDEGQRAVAQVVLNRVRHPAWPNTVCGVVYQGSNRIDLKCQFSFSCDGAMARLPNAAGWAEARQIAVEALSGKVFAPIGLSTYYHSLAVSPDWSARLQQVAVVGAHIFYRWRGDAGLPGAFHAYYAGIEPLSGPALSAVVSRNAPIEPTVMISPPIGPDSVPGTTAPVPRLPMSGIRAEYLSSGQPMRQNPAEE